MSDTKFTPKPWTAHPYNRQLGTLISWGDISKGQSVCIVMSTMDDVTAQANATLIAAAPEMYEALKAVVTDEGLLDVIAGVGEGEPPFMLKIRDALAKAVKP